MFSHHEARSVKRSSKNVIPRSGVHCRFTFPWPMFDALGRFGATRRGSYDGAEVSGHRQVGDIVAD